MTAGALPAGLTLDPSSGVIDGNLREAVAITELDRLDLGGGQVVLAGLRWEAVHRTGAKEEMLGRFTIGSATIAGQPVEVPEQDPSAVLGPVNDALKPLGLVLRPPRVYDAKGIQFVDPISIGVVPAQERETEDRSSPHAPRSRRATAALRRRRDRAARRGRRLRGSGAAPRP